MLANLNMLRTFSPAMKRRVLGCIVVWLGTLTLLAFNSRAEASVDVPNLFAQLACKPFAASEIMALMLVGGVVIQGIIDAFRVKR